MRNNKSTLRSRLTFLTRYYFLYAMTFAKVVSHEFRARLSRLLPVSEVTRKSPRGKVIRFFSLIPLVVIGLYRFALERAIRALTRIAGVIRFVHRKISGRALDALINKYPEREDSQLIFRELRRQITFGNATPTVFVMAISLAIKLGELDMARSYADLLLQSNPDAFNEHQQAGVWFFIGGYYEDAERIWGNSAENRESTIIEQGLDQFNLRFLGPSWLLAIGHIAHIDTYLKHKVLSGFGSQRTVILRPYQLKIPNQALLECLNQHVEIFPENVPNNFSYRQIELLQDEFWSIRLKPNHTRMFSHAGASVQHDWDQKGYGPLFHLAPDQEKNGWVRLEKLGVPKDRWFVCLHVREAGFHKAWHEKHPGTRNAEISTYMKAVHRVIDSGGYVVRVGDSSMSKLPQLKGLIDYAVSNEKSEEMDIFLCAKARFFIGTNSGLGLVPAMFGVPCAMTNWTPIALPQWYGRDRFIPKSIYSVKLGRALSLSETFTSPAAWQQFRSYFDASGLEVHDNTAEEIEELVLELLEETAGVDMLTAEDRKLVQGYNRLAVQNGSYVGSRLGRAYLRRHADELLQFASQEADAAQSPVDFAARQETSLH